MQLENERVHRTQRKHAEINMRMQDKDVVLLMYYIHVDVVGIVDSDIDLCPSYYNLAQQMCSR